MSKTEASSVPLWQPDRKGTLIVSDPRFGTHFLQRIIADAVARERPVEKNDEIDLAPIQGWPQSVRSVLERLGDRESYQVAIVNSVVAKNELIAHPEALAQWHVIRLTRRNKIGWFRSFGLFFMHEHSELNSTPEQRTSRLLHHGTPQEDYLDSLASQGPMIIDAQTVNQIGGNLSLHLLSKLVAVDVEVDYDDLPGMQSEHTWWKGNQYPDMAMDQMFADWSEIEPILANWHEIDLPGRFR